MIREPNICKILEGITMSKVIQHGVVQMLRAQNTDFKAYILQNTDFKAYIIQNTDCRTYILQNTD